MQLGSTGAGHIKTGITFTDPFSNPLILFRTAGGWKISQCVIRDRRGGAPYNFHLILAKRG